MADMGTELCPYRTAYWFDDRPDADYIELNSRFWQLYRTVAHGVAWEATDMEVVPFMAVWFGAVLPYEIALRRIGYPHAWCAMLGAPTDALAEEARSLVRADRPLGLIIVEEDPPLPDEYSLPLAGLITKGAFLAFEYGRIRYEHLHGYEIISPHDEIEGLVLEELQGAEAERGLLRLLAFSVARSIGTPARSDWEEVMAHARELWAIGATQAAGVVAGTAFEALLRYVLKDSDAAWLAAKRTLGPLITRTSKRLSLSQPKRAELDSLRELRNECAHALTGESGDSASEADLRLRVDQFIGWLELHDSQTIEERGLIFPVIPPSLDLPVEALCEEARTAADQALHATEPIPIKVVSDGVEQVVPGLCGFAWIFVRASDEELKEWLLSNMGGSVEDGGLVRMSAFSPDQSVERAAAYARAFSDRLRKAGMDAWYEMSSTDAPVVRAPLR
jgi:hypothetical protein